MLHKVLACSTAATALALTSAQAQNLLVNGSFEDAGGFTANPITTTSGPGGISGVDQGWANFGAAQSDMSSANSYPEDGNYTLLAQNGPGNNWNPQGTYQIVDGIVANDTYTLSAYFLQDSSSGNTGTYGTPVAIQLGFGNLVGANWVADGPSYTWGFGDNGSNDGSVAALDTWYNGSLTALAPDGATEAAVYLFYMDNGQTTVDQMYFDNASLTVASVPEPTTLALAGLGGVSLLSLIRRRKS